LSRSERLLAEIHPAVLRPVRQYAPPGSDGLRQRLPVHSARALAGRLRGGRLPAPGPRQDPALERPARAGPGVKSFGEHDLVEFAARLDELRTTFAPPAEPGEFVAYTDGACFGNPRGPGGWAAAVFVYAGDGTWHLFGHLSSTSNNRAEA